MHEEEPLLGSSATQCCHWIKILMCNCWTLNSAGCGEISLSVIAAVTISSQVTRNNEAEQAGLLTNSCRSQLHQIQDITSLTN